MHESKVRSNIAFAFLNFYVFILVVFNVYIQVLAKVSERSVLVTGWIWSRFLKALILSTIVFASQTYLVIKPSVPIYFNLTNIFLVGFTPSGAQPNQICDLQKTNELSYRAYAASCPSLVPPLCDIPKSKGDALRYSTQRTDLRDQIG